MNSYWILEGHKPVECDSIEEWCKMFEDIENRRVALDQCGDIVISTVFLGLDHRFSGKGPPLLFETLISGGEHSNEGWRYSSWEEAERGHKKACILVLVNEEKRRKRSGRGC